jgi:hypothetical protein
VTNSATLEAFLLSGLALLVLRAHLPPWPRAPVWIGVLTGVVLGAMLLVRPTTAVIWILWCLALLWRRGPRAPTLRFLAAATGVALLVIAPWTIRNARVHHRLVPIATNGGFNFYGGNNPIWKGEIPRLEKVFARMPPEDLERWRSMTEVERDRALYRKGLEYWRREPAHALAGLGRKAVSFVFFRPFLFAGYPAWLAIIFIASYLLLLLPFAIALPRCRGPACALPLLAIFATGLLGCVYLVSMRFRASVEPLFAAIAAGRLVGRD